MIREHLLRLAFVTALLIAFLHISAVNFFLYWSYWWFDIPMHLLGGFFLGLLSLWFLVFYSQKGFAFSQLQTLFVAVLGALFVGLVWELFEYSAGITFNSIGSYPLDTIKDLIMDVTGGYVAYVYCFYKIYRQKVSF